MSAAKLTEAQRAKLSAIRAAGEAGVVNVSSVSADALVRKGLVHREVVEPNVPATRVGAIIGDASFGTRADLYTVRGKMRYYTVFRYTIVDARLRP